MKKVHKRMNWDRYLWLALRHYERIYERWAERGAYTLCDVALKNVNHYRAQLGMRARGE